MIICLGTTPALQRSMVFGQFQLDAVNRASEVTEYASGKSINAARVLRTLGQEVLATGFLGADTGRLVREDLDRAAIPHDFCEVAARTRMCITLIDRATSQATELVEESRCVEDGDWTALLDKLKGHLRKASALLLLGSLTPGAPQDFYAQCTQLATAVGVRTILDAKGPPLNLALSERPFLVKPNRRELEETIGSPIRSEDDLRQAIRSLLARGPSWAVVTSGPAGAVASDGDSFWEILPPPVKAISPIGSGDSFAAGMAAAVVQGATVPDACILGTACAVANALTPLAGHVEREDVERLRRQVELREWR